MTELYIEFVSIFSPAGPWLSTIAALQPEAFADTYLVPLKRFEI